MPTIAQPTYGCNNGHAAPAMIPQGPATPEALCSMNGFVKIGRAETRTHQVTGRGATPEEAAANYFGSLDALEAGYAARAAREALLPPLPSRTERLSRLLACGLEKTTAKGDWRLVDRLTKAVALVLAGRVVPMGDGTYQVRSQTEPETTMYEVSGRACTCPDSRKHEADEQPYRCKHILSYLFVLRLDDQEKASPSGQ